MPILVVQANEPRKRKAMTITALRSMTIAEQNAWVLSFTSEITRRRALELLATITAEHGA